MIYLKLNPLLSAVYDKSDVFTYAIKKILIHIGIREEDFFIQKPTETHLKTHYVYLYDNTAENEQGLQHASREIVQCPCRCAVYHAARVGLAADAAAQFAVGE